MGNRKLVMISISGITMILSLVSMLYFGNELDNIGTYESIELLYMLASQAVCGVGLVGLVLALKISIPKEQSA